MKYILLVWCFLLSSVSYADTMTLESEIFLFEGEQVFDISSTYVSEDNKVHFLYAEIDLVKINDQAQDMKVYFNHRYPNYGGAVSVKCVRRISSTGDCMRLSFVWDKFHVDDLEYTSYECAVGMQYKEDLFWLTSGHCGGAKLIVTNDNEEV